MRLIKKDYVSMEVQEGTLQVDVPLDGLEDFYSFLEVTFNSFDTYI